MNQSTVDNEAFMKAFMQTYASMAGQTTKAVGSTPSTIMGHGVGGLFSDPGLMRPVFSAMTLPQIGLQSVLPYYPSQFQQATYGLITGVTATSGTEANAVCDDWPTSGLVKLCEQTYVFDRKGLQSQVLLDELFGKLANRADHQDLQMVGNLMPFANPNVPTITGNNPEQVLNNEIAKVLFQLGASMSTKFSQRFYTGTPASNTAGGGTKYYYGLDTLIDTGYRDAITGIACPAADSIVMTYTGGNISNNYGNIVRLISNIWFQQKRLDAATGLNPVKRVIVMSPGLFYDLTEAWPFFYNYNAQRQMAALSTDTFRTTFDGANALQQTLNMRGDISKATGHYLMIQGEQVDVIIDEAIVETAGALGSFTSSIYFVPLTVKGGIPVTYMEYFNYDAETAAAIARFAGDQYTSVSDGGHYLWRKKPPTNGCMQISVQSEERLILRTPHLAARLDNVSYTPVQHERTSFPGGTYYVNGGQTSYQGYGPSLYSPTS